jgi:[ribosomal protein S5]-alanine N-acetyltransferase
MRPVAIPIPVLSPDEGGFSLREWNADDVRSALDAGLDPLVSRYRYSLPRSAKDARQWLERVAADRQSGVRLEMAITEHDAVIGSVSLTEFEHGNAMIRYWLLPTGRGRGAASWAVNHLSQWAFSDLDVGRIAAFVEFDNQRSGAVLERCGFVLEGHLRRHMAGHNGIRVDTLLYGLLPEDVPQPD